MNATSPDTRPQPVPSLWRLLLFTPLWAVPFALFFGTVFGARWATYRLAYLDSLVFAFCIRLALLVAARWIVPALPIERTDRAWLPISAVHVVAAMVGSFAGAFTIHWFLQPGFLGNGGGLALLMVAMWSLLFSALFTGIILAYRFHQHAVERAAQVERIQAELVRAELRALRSQVNPHFLFNTLNSIAALIAENPVAAEDLTTRLADVFAQTLGRDDREAPGSGAAGGIGFSARTWLGAGFRPGIEVVAEIGQLAEAVRGASLVFTGEGRMDSQTLRGKTPMGVARIAREAGVPVVAIAGSLGEGYQKLYGAGIHAAFSLAEGPCTLESACRDAARLLADRASDIMRVWLAARHNVI